VRSVDQETGQDRPAKKSARRFPAITPWVREVIVGSYARTSGDAMPETLTLIADGAAIPPDLLREMKAERTRVRGEAGLR